MIPKSGYRFSEKIMLKQKAATVQPSRASRAATSRVLLEWSRRDIATSQCEYIHTDWRHPVRVCIGKYNGSDAALPRQLRLAMISR